MKDSDILLTLDNAYLKVWAAMDGSICVHYRGAEVKDGPFLASAFGCGSSFEEACTDYLSKIRGKTLVFNSCTDSSSRREVTVLG